MWGLLFGLLAGGIIGHFTPSRLRSRMLFILGGLVGFFTGGLVHALLANTCG
jgi:hypothetical protein